MAGTAADFVYVRECSSFLTGEQKQEHIDEAKNKKYLRTERTFANVERTLRIPKGVDTSKVQASYENGILHVSLHWRTHQSRELRALGSASHLCHLFVSLRQVHIPKVPEPEKKKTDIQVA